MGAEIHINLFGHFLFRELGMEVELWLELGLGIVAFRVGKSWEWGLNKSVGRITVGCPEP